jgi:hypothetical protein
MSPALDHATALAGVADAVSVMVSKPDASEAEVVRLLQQQGYSVAAAEKLNFFVPSAFSWALLRRMGVKSFPNHYVALDARGSEVELPIGKEHYFTAALQLAYITLEEGWSEKLPREAFEAVVSRSAEIGAANKALGQNDSLEGAVLGAPKTFRLSAEVANGS